MAIPTGVVARLGAGVALPLRGLGYLAAHRALWAYAALPIVITLAGLVAGLVLAVPLSGFVLDLLWTRPEGVVAGAWWAARAALYLVLVYVAAVALPVAVSAPFADRLSERVEALELGAPGSAGSGGLSRAAAETWAGVAHGLVRLGWLVLGHILLLPTLLVPLAYPVLAFLWTARWTAVEYLDLPMARNLHRLREVKAALRSVRPLGFGFGGALAASFLVPLANLLVVPVGAVAGTLLYCDLVEAGAIARPPPGAPGAGTRAEPAPRPTSGGARLLVSVLLGVSLLVVPSAAIIVAVATLHPVYAESVARLEADAGVRRALGAPVRPGLWASARIVGSGGSWRFSVSGPRGAADIDVSATRREGTWALTSIRVRPQGAERSFSLDLRAPGGT